MCYHHVLRFYCSNDQCPRSEPFEYENQLVPCDFPRENGECWQDRAPTRADVMRYVCDSCRWTAAQAPPPAVQQPEMRPSFQWDERQEQQPPAYVIENGARDDQRLGTPLAPEGYAVQPEHYTTPVHTCANRDGCTAVPEGYYSKLSASCEPREVRPVKSEDAPVKVEERPMTFEDCFEKTEERPMTVEDGYENMED